MKKVCKLRCYPNKTQEQLIHKTLGACRWIYNHYIEYNQKVYEEDKKFISAYDYAKIVTKMKKEPEYQWLSEISSKAIKDSILSAEKTFKRFFKGLQLRLPRFKSRKQPTQSFFFIKDAIHFNTGKKNIIKIPILGDMRITERDYLPDRNRITSGRVIYSHGKYYLMFIYDIEPENRVIYNEGIGIDVGIKNYLTCVIRNTGYTQVESFLKYTAYKKLDSKIKKLQTIISHKVEINYNRKLHQYMDKHNGEVPKELYKNIMKGESYNTSQIKKLQRKLRRMYEKRTNYTKDKVNKIVSSLVRAKPEYITIEDLQVKSMLGNDSSHKLHDYIQKSMFYYFRERLTQKCHECNVELRIPVKLYFASSKKCCICGNKKKNLSLSDRIYQCENCGNRMDRDVNAANNLCYLKKYIVI